MPEGVEMTTKQKRHFEILLKRIDVLKARVLHTRPEAAFFGEMLQELHAMEWAVAVIREAAGMTEVKIV